MMKSFFSMFTGFDLVGVGAKQAGYEIIGGIEFDPAIAEVACANGHPVTTADVLTVNLRRFDRPDLFHASPPCPNFSVAKSGRGETQHDIDLAESVCNFLRHFQPPAFTLENVPAYRHSQSFARIMKTLEDLGYMVDARNINSADYGVPQTRNRLWVRAVRGGLVPNLPNAGEWQGWYQAIEDLLPTLPESKFAKWQLARINPELIRQIEASGYETIATKVLQVLRERVGTQVFLEWGARILSGFQPSPVLRPQMYGSSFRAGGTESSGQQGQFSSLFEEVCKGWGLRDLRGIGSEGRSSQEPGLDRQFLGEFAAYLSQLSHENSQSEKELFNTGVLGDALSVGLLQQALSSFQEIWRSVAHRNKDSRAQEEADYNASRFGRNSQNQEMANILSKTFKESEREATGTGPVLTINAQTMFPQKAFIVQVQGAHGDIMRNSSEPMPTVSADHAAAKYRAFIVNTREGHRGGDLTTISGDAPIYALPATSTGSRHRAWLSQGRVVSMTPRALARFQTVPDDYELPDKKSLACRGIGNGVPCELARVIYSGLLSQT